MSTETVKPAWQSNVLRPVRGFEGDEEPCDKFGDHWTCFGTVQELKTPFGPLLYQINTTDCGQQGVVIGIVVFPQYFDGKRQVAWVRPLKTFEKFILKQKVSKLFDCPFVYW